MSERQHKSKGKPAPLTSAESAPHALETARTGEYPGKPIMGRLDAEWTDIVLTAKTTGMDGIKLCLRSIAARSPEKSSEIQKALDHATLPATIPIGPATPNGPMPFSLGIVGIAEFAKQAFIRRFLVQNFLVEGKPAIIAGPKKTLKTSMMVELLISLASGISFLGHFIVPRPVKTLLISGESGEATIQETMRRVCRSKDINPNEMEGMAFLGFKLPNLGVNAELEALASFIRENGIEVAMIDPAYLCLISAKVDAANIFETGPLLKRIFDTCLEAGATPILAHHFKKNKENPYEAPELEDMAWSGFQEIARQWILLGRQRKYEPGSGVHQLWLTVGGSDGHSGEWFVEVNEGVTDEYFSDRDWNVKIASSSEARVQAKIADQASKLERAIEKIKVADDVDEVKERKYSDELVDLLKQQPNNTATVNALRVQSGWRKDKVERVLFRMERAGLVIAVGDVPTTNGKSSSTHPGYRLVWGVIG